MKKIFMRMTLLLLMVLMTGCMLKTPTYNGSTQIKMLDEDKEAYVSAGIIDYKTSLFNHSIDMMWTKDELLDTQKRLDKDLPADKWRLVTDWAGDNNTKRSEWKNGDVGLIVVLSGNLDGTSISNLERRYGITGMEPGATLILMYAYDKNKESPDKTATIQAKSEQATKAAAPSTPEPKK